MEGKGPGRGGVEGGMALGSVDGDRREGERG